MSMKLEFNPEAKFWKVMDVLGDLVKVNVLFILTSFPIVTAGASFTAMYSVIFKMREKREGKISADYFGAFRENFKNSTVIWIFYLMYAAVCYINFFQEYQNRALLFIILGIGFALISMTVFYSFAMLARFRNNLQDTVVKAFIIGASGLPYTLVMALMAAALLILTIQSYLSFMIMASFWILFGFAVTGYADGIMFLRVFSKYTQKENL